MDTQTTQAFGNESKNQDENKNSKWAKAAKVAGAAAAVAGVGGVAASILGDNEDSTVVEEEMVAHVTAEDIQAQQEAVESQSAATEPEVSVDAAYSSPAFTASPRGSHAASQPREVHHSVSQEPVHNDVVEQTATVETATHPEFATDEHGIPVDTQWLADDVNPGETVPSTDDSTVDSGNASTLNEGVPPISQSAMNILTNTVGDDLTDTVNVSPEIFMSMMGLKPTDMIQTELNGDGQVHMATLLANDNGEYMMLVDSDGDGFLDTLTDISGNEYAMFSEGIHFEVNIGEMQAFVNEINPETLVDTPMYASAGAEIAGIEGDGTGDEVAFVDENDIMDTPDDDELLSDESLETADVMIDEDLDEFDIDEELAANDDLSSHIDDINTDLVGFDDSSLA